MNMLLIWNQLHLKEKTVKPWDCKNELDHKYSLDVRGRRKRSLGKCLLKQVVQFNGQRLTLETEQTNCYKSNKHNLSTYRNTFIISFS